MKNYNNKWSILRNKRKHLLSIIHGSRCIICGDTNINHFTYHHINPQDKKFGIGSKIGGNFTSIIEESKKCVLLCNNCHRELHDGLFSLLKNQITFNKEKYNEYLGSKKYSSKNVCSNCGKFTNNKSYCSYSCSHENRRKVERPTKDELRELIKLYSYNKIGKNV
jgi:hypothetical protein